MVARESEPPEPSWVKEPVRPPLAVRVLVATPYTPFDPLLTKRFDEASDVVVARPVYVIVLLLPPTRLPRVPDVVKGPLIA
jgi:hypothetical protein